MPQNVVSRCFRAVRMGYAVPFACMLCFAGSPHAADSEDIDYFDSEPTRLKALEYVRRICLFSLGQSSLASRANCDGTSCTYQYDIESTRYDLDIFLDHEFTLLFSSSHEFDSKKSTSSHFDLDGASSGRSIKVIINRTIKGLPRQEVIDMARCVKDVGAKLAETMKISDDTIGISSDNREKKASSELNMDSYVLKELENATFRVIYQKAVTYGEEIILRALVIPSLRMGRARAEYDGETDKEIILQLKSNLNEFNKLKSEASDKERDMGLYSSKGHGYYLDIEKGNFTMAWRHGEIVQRPSQFNELKVTLKADGASITPLTPDEQRIAPLMPREWAWLLKWEMEGPRKAYVTLSSNGIAGDTQFADAFEIGMTVEDTWAGRVSRFAREYWQWVAGSLVLPLVGVLWAWLRSENSKPTRAMQRPAARRRRI